MNETIKNSSRYIGLIFWVLITVIPIIGIILSLIDPISFFSTQEQIREFSSKYDNWAPILFIALQILQVVVAPLSHYSVGYMGGFLYGPILGGIYNYIGRVIGHLIAFGLSRSIGSPIVRKFVPSQTIAKYDKFVSNRADVLFLVYFLPLFPDDEISYLVGLSKMRFNWFLIANLLGHVGGSLSLSYMGSGIDTKDPYFWVLFISTLAGFPILFYLARRKPVATTNEKKQ